MISISRTAGQGSQVIVVCRVIGGEEERRGEAVLLNNALQEVHVEAVPRLGAVAERPKLVLYLIRVKNSVFIVNDICSEIV